MHRFWTWSVPAAAPLRSIVSSGLAAGVIAGLATAVALADAAGFPFP